jgi:ubiquinone/menaquinone biosynthesis C-methylase UbiE
MTAKHDTGDGAIHRQVSAVWDQNAAFWDAFMGEEGNAFHRELVAPAAERLLGLRAGEEVLEIACGSGLFARRMAQLGATVLATDASAAFLERARTRTAAYAGQVTWMQVDATEPEQLVALGENRFHAAVCNMALMDIADVEPLFAALPRLLKSSGRFVFTIMHPCFNNSSCVRVAEQANNGERVTTTYAIKVSTYKSLGPTQGIGIQGQPVPQWYFHRTLSDLFGQAFRAGLVLDGMEEPTFAVGEDGDGALSARRFREMPMVLAARLRPGII